MTEAVPVPKPWERQAGESEEAWLAFRAYRDMPPTERIMRRAAALEVATISKWYRDFDWVERVRAFDAEMDQVSLEERKRLLELAARDMAIEHSVMLADARELVQREMRKLLDTSRQSEMPGVALKPNEVIRLLEQAIKLDRLVRGQSTEQVETTIDVSKLSIDELRDLERLMTKAKKE